MKKYLLFLLAVFSMFIVGCSNDDTNDDVIDGFRLNKTEFTEAEEIVIEVEGYGKGYYLGVFSMTSEPGKSGTYKRKALNDEEKIYSFEAGDLRGPGEYQIFLYKKTYNDVVKREVIKVVDGNTTDYGISNATLSVSVSDLVYDTTLLIFPSQSNNGVTLTYRMYWAKDGERLEDYNCIKEVKHSTSEEFFVKFNQCMFAPIEANQIEIEVYEGASKKYYVDLNDAYKIPESNYLFNFQVVSDIHLDGEFSFTQHTNHLETALNEFSNLSNPSSGVFIVGDLTNFGSEGNYTFLKNTFDTLTNEKTPDIYFAIGNHECQYFDTYEEAKEDFLNFVNRDSVYCSYTIGGSKFILLGQEDLTTQGTMTLEQVNWLKSELEQTSKDTPTFIFMHQPLYETVVGSYKGQSSGMGNVGSQLRAILKEYPNAILFSGHSHKIPTLENTIKYGFGSDATYANTGSLGYLLSAEDDEIGGSSGIYVEVYEDYILLKYRDFLAEKWYASSQYIIPIKK